jgi:hypothetical protein
MLRYTGTMWQSRFGNPSCMCMPRVPSVTILAQAGRVTSSLSVHILGNTAMQVQGVVRFRPDGSARLDLVPGGGQAQPAPERLYPVPPTPQQVLDQIRDGVVAVHPTRNNVKKSEVQVMMSNTQRALGLTPGPQGEWSPVAGHRLCTLLAGVDSA